MFRAVFGRKVASPAGPVTLAAAIPVAPVQSNAALALLQRLDPDYPDYTRFLSAADKAPRDQAFWRASQLVTELDQAARTDLLCAIAETGALARHEHIQAKTAEGQIASRLKWVLDHLTKGRHSFDATPRLFSAAARLLGEFREYSAYLYSCETWQQRLAAMVAAGHIPTAEDCDWLVRCKAGVLARKDRQRDLREEARRFEAIVRWIDKVCGTEPDGAERIVALTTRTEEDGCFPAEPPNFAFWVEFIAASAKQVKLLMSEVGAKTPPSWLDDETEYSRRFPPVEGLSRSFGWWNAEDGDARFGNGRLRGYGWAIHCGNQPATEAVFRACVDVPRTLENLNIVWGTNAIPGHQRLADLAVPEQAALLLHLADAKAGAKPPSVWLKTARTLIDAEGRDSVRARLVDWLELWAKVAPSSEETTRLHNYFTMVSAAAWLQSVVPDLPTLADRARLDQAAQALALQAGSRNIQPQFLFCSDRGWLGSVLGRPAGQNGGRRLPTDKLKPSLSNEAVLRGVIWLVGEFDDPAIVDLLERTALSAMAFSDGRGARSRSTANAAIYALARIGSQPALETLGRVRRTIRDKAIANSVNKAIGEVAAKLGVAAPDVEEMSVPDYGFG